MKHKITLYLSLGILFSILSKFFQFFTPYDIGDLLVLFAGVFFLFAIAFSLPFFQKLYLKQKKDAIQLLTLSSIALVSFQLLLILVIGNGIYLGFILLPAIVTSLLFLVKKSSKLGILKK